MSQSTVLKCDIFYVKTKCIKRVRTVVQLQTPDGWVTSGVSVESDMCERARTRLWRFINRGSSPPGEEKTKEKA